MRVDELKVILEKKKCDFAFFHNSGSTKTNPNVFYFARYDGLGALVIPKKSQPFLIVPEMELQRAKGSSIKKVYSMDKKKFFESANHVIRLKKIKAMNIAIDRDNFTLNSYKSFKRHFKKAKSKDIRLDCLKLREIKTEKEVQIIKRSCSYADKILQKAIRDFKDFKTETSIAAFLVYETKKFGLEIAFDPIVASGSNGSMPHYEPSNIKIKNGFCVIDFGVKYKGYCSDMTRTVYVGKPQKKEKDFYNLLSKIQEEAIDLLKINKKCSELYDFVCKSLGKHKDNFIHGLGHGIGVEIHELPNLTLNSKDRIQNDMVFTIEPGIYFPRRFGIRIEDTLLFKNKPIVLTNTSKDLLIV